MAHFTRFGSRWHIVVLLCLAAAAPARALVIDPVFSSSVTSATDAAEIETAFDYAAQQYEDLFNNPITIKIDVTSVPGTGTLGESNENFINSFTYSQVRTALEADPTFAAITSLPMSDPTSGGTFLIADPEAMALGLLGSTGTDINGTFTFGAGWDYDFNSADRAVSGEIDFIGVAEHELSEIMGRGELLGKQLTGGPDYEPFDLFRFTTSGVRSLVSSGTGVYFSLNNGATDLDNFNGPTGGDVQDWATTMPYTPDSYNAFSQAGYDNDITGVDVSVMEALGFTPAPVPEPQTLAWVALGALFILRRARRCVSG